MEKNPERARELLTWIQDAIKAKKLSDPVFTESGTRSAWPFNEFLKQKPYKTIPKKLRRYGKRHASRIYGGKNTTPEHLKYLLKVTLRQELDCLNAEDNYAMGDTESENQKTTILNQKTLVLNLTTTQSRNQSLRKMIKYLKSSICIVTKSY